MGIARLRGIVIGVTSLRGIDLLISDASEGVLSLRNLGAAHEALRDAYVVAVASNDIKLGCHDG